VILLAILLYLAVEIAVFVVVAEHIGVLLAVILVLGISATGPMLIRRAGTGVLEHARVRIRRGETPDHEVLDGVVLLFGGVLVCIPGFVGDVVGLLLLISPVRHAAIRLTGHHLGRRVGSTSMWSVTPGFGRRGADPTIVDAATHEPGAHGHDDPPPPALQK
jgi:UPF0716 protein FxsA